MSEQGVTQITQINGQEQLILPPTEAPGAENLKEQRKNNLYDQGLKHGRSLPSSKTRKVMKRQDAISVRKSFLLILVEMAPQI
jgi:hypothetical protein